MYQQLAFLNCFKGKEWYISGSLNKPNGSYVVGFLPKKHQQKK